MIKVQAQDKNLLDFNRRFEEYAGKSVSIDFVAEQFRLYQEGVRDVRIHDFTLVYFNE